MNVHTTRRLLILTLAAIVGCSGPQPTYVPHDPVLKKLPLFFDPTKSAAAPAASFFFGNDVAFWKPHQELAVYRSEQVYSVAGFDIRSFLANLPDNRPQRDSAFRG